MTIGVRLLRMTAIAILAVVILIGGAVAATTAGPAPPKQFYRPLLQPAVLPSAPTMVVAHNAGNNPATASQALLHGATVIEIDVLFYDGHLRAAHSPPATETGKLRWRISPPPLLSDVWAVARDAPAVQLDLKSHHPRLMPLLLEFLDERRAETSVIVSSPDVHDLDRIVAAYPEVGRFLSIGSSCALAVFEARPETLQSVTGVSVRASLLDNHAAAMFRERGLAVIAWTVDDATALDRILALGVDGITTNNLAIIDDLSANIPQSVIA